MTFWSFFLPVIPSIISSIMGGSNPKPIQPDYTSYNNKITELQDQINSINNGNSVEKQKLIDEQNKLRADINRMNQQNEALNNMILELNKQISGLNEIAQKDMKTYIKIKEYLLNKNLVIKRTNNFVIIGPKGQGKSTFLWLQGLVPKPEKTTIDGTTEIKNVKDCVDTIGINIELNLLIKLFAVLLIKGLPYTMILCCNDRIERALLILSHLLIRKMYIVMINAKALHTKLNKDGKLSEIDDDEIYDIDTYKELYKQKVPVVPLKHDTPVDNINTFDDAMSQLFPNNKIELPEWGDFTKNQNTIMIIKYQLCKAVYEYCENFNSDERLYLNQIE